MGFWIFMMIMDLLIPLTMIGFGSRFLTKPPKNINWAYGYRTTRSMKNEDTWLYAHSYCGRLWLKMGWALLMVSTATMLLVLGKDKDTVGGFGGMVCVLQLLCLVGSIIPTELALKKTFDEHGRRR